MIGRLSVEGGGSYWCNPRTRLINVPLHSAGAVFGDYRILRPLGVCGCQSVNKHNSGWKCVKCVSAAFKLYKRRFSSLSR